MEKKRVYKYKLDFYYKSLIVYLVFLVLYVIIRGSFSDKTFEVVFKDPIIYIVAFFIVFFLGVLIYNMIWAREIIFDDRKIIFKNRFGAREVAYNEIKQVKFSRQKKNEREGRTPVRIAKLKLENRRRFMRVRISDFYDENLLAKEFKGLARQIAQNEV